MGIIVTPTELAAQDSRAADDILDMQSSPVAQHFEQMLHKYKSGQRDSLIESLKGPLQGSAPNTDSVPSKNSDWFLPESSKKPLNSRPVITTTHDQKIANPSPVIAPTKTTENNPKPPMTETSYADILNLARNNDLNIATIARQVNSKQASFSQDEVVIPLR